MDMRLGANIPYTDRPLPKRSWRILEALGPDELTLCSFTDTDSLATLLWEYPTSLLHIRPRVGPQNMPWAQTYDEAGADILSYRSWDTERSMRDCLDQILSTWSVPMDGKTAYGRYWVTVLMGNEISLEWAVPYPDHDQVAQAAHEYVEWYKRQADAIRNVYGKQVGIAVAPLAEGSDAREMLVMDILASAGLYEDADVLADHNYFDQFPPSHPEWGARGLRMLEALSWPVATKGGIRNTETNGGPHWLEDEDVRARKYAEYVEWATGTGLYDSVSLFTVPGTPDDEGQPIWWFIDDLIAKAAGDTNTSMPILAPQTPQEPPEDPPATTEPVEPTEPPTTPPGDDPMPPETPAEPGAYDVFRATMGGQSLSADELHAKRWQLNAWPASLPLVPPFNPGFGFETAWRVPANAWWGSPVTVNEDTYDTGNARDTGEPETYPARVFTNAVVIYRNGAAEVLP